MKIIQFQVILRKKIVKNSWHPVRGLELMWDSFLYFIALKYLVIPSAFYVQLKVFANKTHL